MNNKLLFVGQERSKLAQERGVYWEDEAQRGKIRAKALYIQHIRERLGEISKKSLTFTPKPVKIKV